MINKKRKLSKYPGLWRVDAVGSIQASNSGLRKSVTIYFTKIKDAYIDNPFHHNASSNEHLALSFHPANIYHFKIGTVWQNGEKIHDNKPIDKPFIIKVNGDNVRCIYPYKKLKLNNNIWADKLFSTDYLNFGGNKKRIEKNTLFVIIYMPNNDDIKWLIVPCSELMRFYYGVSTRLITAAIEGTYDKYIDSNKSYLDNRVLHIFPNTAVSRNELNVLARVESCARAKTNLNSIHTYISKTHFNNTNNNIDDPLQVRCRFPFQGETSFRVGGEKVTIYEKSSIKVNAFFVTEIFNCTAPVKFDMIKNISDQGIIDDILPLKNSGDFSQHYNKKSPSHKYSDTIPGITDDANADARISRIVVRDYGSRFASFHNIKVIHEKTKKNVGNIGNLPTNGENTPGVGVITLDDGNYTNDAKGNIGTDYYEKSLLPRPPRDLALFIGMSSKLRILLEKNNLQLTTIKLNGLGYQAEAEWITYFPKNVWRQRRKWHKVPSIQTEGYRSRELVIVEILNLKNNTFFYLMEMELVDKDAAQCTFGFHLNDFSKATEQLLEKLLVLTTIQRRWPALTNNWVHENEEQEAHDIFTKIRTIRIPHSRILNESDVNNGSYFTYWAEKIYEELHNTLISKGFIR